MLLFVRHALPANVTNQPRGGGPSKRSTAAHDFCFLPLCFQLCKKIRKLNFHTVSMSHFESGKRLT